MALTIGTKLTDLTAVQVRELQDILSKLGYNVGPLDGVLGPQTQAAYSSFLIANGLATRGANTAILKQVAELSADPNGSSWTKVTRGPEAPVSATNAFTPPSTPPPPANTPAPPASAPATTATPVAAELSASEQEQEVRNRFPTLAYLLNDPEIRPILVDAATGALPPDQMQGRMMQTNWWLTTSESTRVWDGKFQVDPAKAKAEWDQKTISVSNKAQQLGVPMDAAGAEWVAGRILREGWSDDQLNRFFGQLAREAGGAQPGQITGTMAEFKQLGRDYLSTMDEKTAMEYAIRISEGTLSREGVETMLRTEAKNRFGWLAPQIDAGLTPTDLFASTRGAVAKMLEIDPEQIDLNDPRWSQLTSPVSEQGATRSMNFYEAQRWARQRPEWRMTDNANRAASDTALSLMKSLGVVK